MRAAYALAGAFLLAGCGNTITPLTPAQQAQITAAAPAAVLLGTIAVQNNTTSAALEKAGETDCGQAVSPQGVLIGDGIVALLNLAGLPVAVTGAGQQVVAGACQAIGLVAGALPPTTDPASVPTATVNTSLPVAKPTPN